VGSSLEKKRLRDAIAAALDRLEQELRSAREVQLSMVPGDFPAPTPARPVEIFATLEPAREIGGDLYDFFWGDDGRLHLVVADVSGKGAPAALFMARTKTALRLAAALAPAAPHEIVARVNAELCLDNRHGMFVTLFFGVLDPALRTLAFCNAGHNPPYVVSRDGGVVPVGRPRGIPLGIRPAFAHATGELRLAPDASVFLFTDGITEAMDAAGELFGEGRLEAALRSLAGESAGTMVREVVGAVRAFAGAAPQADDIAALALRLVR
jgi:sigma-B regulation protein RsbU (phosphoserine phosphatase)